MSANWTLYKSEGVGDADMSGIFVRKYPVAQRVKKYQRVFHGAGYASKKQQTQRTAVRQRKKRKKWQALRLKSFSLSGIQMIKSTKSLRRKLLRSDFYFDNNLLLLMNG